MPVATRPNAPCKPTTHGFPNKSPGRLKKRAPKNLKLQLGPEALNIGGGAPAGRDSGGASGGSAGPNPLSGNTVPGSSYHKLSEQLASLELTGAKRRPGEAAQSLSNDDLEFISELGAGNGGTVTKVRHIPTGQVFAKKVVFVEAKPAVRKQIVRELQIMHECDAPFIIDFVGAYLTEPHICMCMEYMDRGSLDQIYKRKGPIPFAICARVASVVVRGLTYLYDVHRIIHRDVKPSNILANSRGELKICDFGVSGELINSIADTFVGTSTYMSPERIQGGQYTVKSDVWSLGVTLIELALGRFPFSDDDENGVGSILDLLQHIVNEPSPRLPGVFPAPLRSFTDDCLAKDPMARAAPKALLQHSLITSDTLTKPQLATWLNSP